MMQQKRKDFASGKWAQKRQPKLPFSSRWILAYFFGVRCANLLRNFSTRPPSESTLFCVPV